MNREIKFRAWHSNANNWVMKCDIPKCFVEEKDCVAFDAPRHIKLMQFTGQKDKNEKDIYEGDIVKDDGTTFKIEWYKGRFDFVRIKGCYQQPYFGDNCSRMEIIGNIYENPELLSGVGNKE